MAVPSWVYDDTISDEEKLRRFEKDMRFNLIMLSMVPVGMIIGLTLRAAGVI